MVKTKILQNALLGIYNLGLNVYLTPLMLMEQKRGYRKEKNERPLEYGFALQWIGKLQPDTILDIGTGTSSFPHLVASCGYKVTAIDKMEEYWKGLPFFNRHYHILKDDITNPKLKKRFDMVICISTLEHIENFRDAVKNMMELLNEGGHLVMTFPYNENKFISNVYEMYPENTYGLCHIFSRSEIDKFIANRGKIICQEYYLAWNGEFWGMGDRYLQLRQTTAKGKHHLTCMVIKKN